MFRFYCTLLISNFLIGPIQSQEISTKCPRQCECKKESMVNLPLMKWLTISMNKYWKQNDSLYENQVINDDNDDIALQYNSIVNSGFCAYQQYSNHIQQENFAPVMEALTLLLGPDSLNNTINDELSSFQDLKVLDIQGFQSDLKDYTYLHHEALIKLQHLAYLNIQNLRLLPNPKLKNKNIPTSAYDSLQKHSKQITIAQPKYNLTFVVPEKLEILPYQEYKFQNLIISTFSHLSDLKFLRLSQCDLEIITWEIFDGLEELEFLSLENNRISKLSEFAFYGTPHLKILILSKNALFNLSSESLAGLFELKHLDVTHNNLKYMSDMSFAPLPNLRTLDLRHNPIISISGSTFEVTKMTKILFIGSDDNSLMLQDKALNGLNKLEKLFISGLNVSILEKLALQGPRILKYLKLEGKIEFIQFDAFTGSIELEILILRNCQIKSISMDSFYGLLNLKTLDLSFNELQTLPTGVFDELENLRELLLTGNKFSSLPVNIFMKLSHIRMIRLDENSWNCSCEMSKWPWRQINRIKKMRLIEKCNYKYDKTPCTIEPEETYIHNAHIAPKCLLPDRYEGWSLSHVVQQKLNCNTRNKYAKLRNYLNSILKQHQQTNSVILTEKTIITWQNVTEFLQKSSENENPTRSSEELKNLTEGNKSKEIFHVPFDDNHKQQELDKKQITKGDIGKSQNQQNSTTFKKQISFRDRNTDHELLTNKIQLLLENRFLQSKNSNTSADVIENNTINKDSVQLDKYTPIRHMTNANENHEINLKVKNSFQHEFKEKEILKENENNDTQDL